jgi:hypothetical protein
MNRGDIILVRFPHPSGILGKKRPAAVDQVLGTLSATMRDSLDDCLKAAFGIP